MENSEIHRYIFIYILSYSSSCKHIWIEYLGRGKEKENLFWKSILLQVSLLQRMFVNERENKDTMGRKRILLSNTPVLYFQGSMFQKNKNNFEIYISISTHIQILYFQGSMFQKKIRIFRTLSFWNIFNSHSNSVFPRINVSKK